MLKICENIRLCMQYIFLGKHFHNNKPIRRKTYPILICSLKSVVQIFINHRQTYNIRGVQNAKHSGMN